jgi:hypothetical protein
MYRLGSIEVRALSAVVVQPVQHFELEREQRLLMGRLWANRFVCLHPGNMWQITQRGLAMIDCSGRIH